MFYNSAKKKTKNCSENGKYFNILERKINAILSKDITFDFILNTSKANKIFKKILTKNSKTKNL